jgi:hypothetical protein
MDSEDNHTQIRIALAGILAAVGASFMSRLPQYIPGQRAISWYHSGFFWLGIGIVILALIVLIVSPRKWRGLWDWYKFKGPSTGHLRQIMQTWRFAPILVLKDLQPYYNIVDGKAEHCELYFTLELIAKYPYGYTKLRLEQSEVLVWQKRPGATGKPYRFLPIRRDGKGIIEITNVNVSRGSPFTYDPIDYQYRLVNELSESYYPDLNRKFSWQLSPIISDVSGNGGAHFRFELPSLHGVHHGPK